MYKKLLITSLVAFIFVVALVAATQHPIVRAANSLRFDSLNKTLATTTTNFGAPFATSTTFFLVPNTVQATSTFTLNTNGIDQLDLRIVMSASSTGSVLRYRYEYSSNNIDWFAEAVAVTSSATTTVLTAGSADQTIAFASSTSGTGGTSTANAMFFRPPPLLNVASPYVRVLFYAQPGTTGVGVNVQGILKSSNSI